MLMYMYINIAGIYEVRARHSRCLFQFHSVIVILGIYQQKMMCCNCMIPPLQGKIFANLLLAALQRSAATF